MPIEATLRCSACVQIPCVWFSLHSIQATRAGSQHRSPGNQHRQTGYKSIGGDSAGSGYAERVYARPRDFFGTLAFDFW